MVVSLRLGNNSRENGREDNVRVSGEMWCTINIHELGGDVLELKKIILDFLRCTWSRIS